MIAKQLVGTPRPISIFCDFVSPLGGGLELVGVGVVDIELASSWHTC
jgi:hypothetical protein